MKTEWKPENPYSTRMPNERRVWQEGGEAYTNAMFKELFDICPHSWGDFRDNNEPVTQYFRHACSQCMEELRLSL